MGVKRVIIGTKAVSDFEWFSHMAKTFSDRVVLGLDARGSKVSTHGWHQDSHLTVMAFAQQAAELPLAAIIYTDISKDGMLCGPNIERTQALAKAVDVPVIASGGVSSLDDIRQLLTAEEIHGVIAGRSLYEGTLDLAEAIRVAQGI
jgi:phosphoribosylformimino-5-aminoimidazole carboxamide ribotide isomerase